MKNLLTVVFVGNFNQDINFLDFYINWVVEFAIENFYIVLKNLWLLLKNKTNVSESNILELCLTSEKRDERCC